MSCGNGIGKSPTAAVAQRPTIGRGPQRSKTRAFGILGDTGFEADRAYLAGGASRSSHYRGRSKSGRRHSHPARSPSPLSFRRWVRLGAYPADWAGDRSTETSPFGER